MLTYLLPQKVNSLFGIILATDFLIEGQTDTSSLSSSSKIDDFAAEGSGPSAVRSFSLFNWSMRLGNRLFGTWYNIHTDTHFCSLFSLAHNNVIGNLRGGNSSDRETLCQHAKMWFITLFIARLWYHIGRWVPRRLLLHNPVVIGWVWGMWKELILRMLQKAHKYSLLVYQEFLVLDSLVFHRCRTSPGSGFQDIFHAVEPSIIAKSVLFRPRNDGFVGVHFDDCCTYFQNKHFSKS